MHDPRLYIGHTPHKPRGCWKVDASNPTGEVRWLASTDYAYLEQQYDKAIVSRHAASFRPRLRMSFGAKLAEEYNTRSQPVLSLDESALCLPNPLSRDTPKDTINLAAQLNATEIPSTYLNVVILVCKRDYFRRLAEEQSKKALLPTLDRHYKSLIKASLLRLARSGDWVETPEDAPTARQVTVMRELKELITYGLGFDHETVWVSREQQDALANPLVREYLGGDSVSRRHLYNANSGALDYLLTKAKVPLPGKYRRHR